MTHSLRTVRLGIRYCVLLATLVGCNRYYSWTTRPPLPTADNYPAYLVDAQAFDPWSGSANHGRWGPNDFELDIERSRDLSGFTAEQERSDYCWAAAVQMVYGMTGIGGLSQEMIVRSVRGSEDLGSDRSATQGDVVRALNGFRPSKFGNAAYIRATEFAASSNGFVEDLAYGWPVIIGLRGSDAVIGHVVVLTRLRYSYGPMREVVIHDATVWDPWPDSGWRQMQGYELREMIRFAVRVRVIHG